MSIFVSCMQKRRAGAWPAHRSAQRSETRAPALPAGLGEPHRRGVVAESDAAFLVLAIELFERVVVELDAEAHISGDGEGAGLLVPREGTGLHDVLAGPRGVR